MVAGLPSIIILLAEMLGQWSANSEKGANENEKKAVACITLCVVFSYGFCCVQFVGNGIREEGRLDRMGRGS